jgi:hypothetical protein
MPETASYGFHSITHLAKTATPCQKLLSMSVKSSKKVISAIIYIKIMVFKK